MSYRNSFLLSVIWGTALAACSQNTAPPKDIAHSTPNNVSTPHTLKKKIAQKAQELERAKLAFERIRIQLINLSQYRNNTAKNEQSNVPFARSNEGRTNEQYVAAQTLEEVRHGDNGGHELDDVSIQSPPDILRAPLYAPETIEEGSANDFSLSLKECFDKAEERFNTSFEGFLKEVDNSSDKHSQSSTSEASEEAQQGDGVRCEPIIAPIQAPYTATMSDEILEYGNSTRTLSSVTALQAEEHRLGGRIKQLEEELDLLRAAQ